ncbi:iron ABC transporter substrate-binding protein [Mesorhizobium australicum]|uniref:Iron ABC transporter substrate-binding protein n=1 Tax=Mesorhizobium australicum TaxID=536018 RepID=A0ACC6T7I6_9HYPH|nr:MULTISPECIES: iron ABC transporter substrate-binding protein [unclassified Mesorhizobium]ESY84493.1 iron ABC transporter substrate-binding protein [Mesorhizobium sp. LNHC220B00]ESY96596.1 iron ABC transporter substrate-binding protein [Mesorhizobium sp. LNHC229A00]ESY97993.1 iron ABC transporter substrate-binding protein [Mesorhizobium sp. LNHC209A00]
MKSPLLALASVAALAISLAAGPATAEDAGIVVYNAQHESLAKEWAEGFTKETGIKVTLRNGGDSDFSNQIVAEGAASPADVFLTENSPAMVLVENAGLFAPVATDTLAQVPQDYQATSGKWVGVAARSTVFVYNTTKLKADQLPKSMLDLADPSWKGRWAASPSGADFQAIVSALLQLKGEPATADWLKAMKENFTAYKGNSTVMKAVNAGEIEAGVIYHYYYFGDQAKTGENSKNVALHYFKNQDPGAFVSVSGGGVLASSKHPKEAQAFLKWVTGKGGQDVLKNGSSFEYAVGKGAQSNPKLVPLADLQAPKVDATTLNSKKVTDLMTAAGLL